MIENCTARGVADRVRLAFEARVDGDVEREVWRRLAASEEPPRYQRQPVGSKLDPFEPVLQRLLEEWPEIGRCRRLTRTILAPDRELEARIAPAAPRLLDLPGCGPLSAAKLLVEIGRSNASTPTLSSPAMPVSRPSKRARANASVTGSTAAATATNGLGYFELGPVAGQATPEALLRTRQLFATILLPLRARTSDRTPLATCWR